MFLEKNITKKINLLYYFEVMGPVTSVDEIIRFLDISPATLKKYIAEINAQANSYTIQYERNQIVVESDHRENGILISRNILADSLNLKLLYRIFVQPATLSDLATEFFTAKSTIVMKIKSINKFFQKHNLAICIENNHVYQIVGEEEIIRKFLQIVFIEMGEYSLFTKNEIIFTEIHAYIEKHFPENNTWYQSLFIDTHLYVSIVRTAQCYKLYQNKKRIPADILESAEVMYQNLRQNVPFVSYLEKTFKTSFTPEFVANALNKDLLRTSFYLEGKVRKETRIWKKVTQLLNDYKDAYNIQMNEDEANECIARLCQKHLLIRDFNQVVLRDFEIHFHYLKAINHTKMYFLLNKMTELGLFVDVNKSLMYEYILYFIGNFKPIRMDFFGIISAKPKKILVYSSKQVNIAEVLEHIIEDKYAGMYDLVIEHVNIIYESFQVDQYDMIISDVYIDDFKGKYLYLSMVPNKEFWDLFEEMLYEK